MWPEYRHLIGLSRVFHSLTLFLENLLSVIQHYSLCLQCSGRLYHNSMRRLQAVYGGGDYLTFSRCLEGQGLRLR
jgi:predicted metal-binding protein